MHYFRLITTLQFFFMQPQIHQLEINRKEKEGPSLFSMNLNSTNHYVKNKMFFLLAMDSNYPKNKCTYPALIA